MLSARTTDDWTTATVQVTRLAVTVAYVPASTIGSAYEWAQGLTTLLAVTWPGWAWTWARDSATGGAILSITGPGAWAVVSDAGAQTLLGMPATEITAGTIVCATAAVGTWAPGTDGALAVSGYLRQFDAAGDACGTGAARPGVPGNARRKPVVEALATRLDAARLAAVLKVCSNPRACTVWQTSESAWRVLTLGAVTQTDAGRTGYRISLACIGEG